MMKLFVKQHKEHTGGMGKDTPASEETIYINSDHIIAAKQSAESGMVELLLTDGPREVKGVLKELMEEVNRQ